MRGKGRQSIVDRQTSRITPACAGKSLPAMLTTSGDRDHPRMCGEKFRPFATMFESKWITPACAGKRETGFDCSGYVWDHPRMCGEKQRDRGHFDGFQGSPPHVRGKD